ncbi:acyl-CoA dehydrogenase NM domain-like protein [Neolentinus lepideus HHB14362 ss-1]|uniref:Acyl-CoA dehydrogenase NM domain-like protein n=1 Tax=Neolentinus lepideus HHB14362 ss-1 TaxID=1314782 RepID=A0A165PTY5_9AGAM|nr:acyl-CoA dehydrogenase NM domain-like protein [Neolentinus lepideus HHB14362 ss-1]
MSTSDVNASKSRLRIFSPISLIFFCDSIFQGLTEPNHGSDPGSMETTAEEAPGGGGFVIDGAKTWISNAHITDIFVIWARCEWDDKVRGFVVEKGTSGLSAPAIKNKLVLRASLTGSVFLDNVKVLQEALLSGTKGLGAYALERHQFRRPLASFQLVQKKLVDAQTEVTTGLLASLQVGRLKDAGKVAPEMISLVKRNNCGKALKHARRVLDILGGNVCADE